jgi:HD-GYP domain-containing protein (c-di-GMP phosphodiesterase class II)
MWAKPGFRKHCSTLLNKEDELSDVDKRELRKHAVYAGQILESLTSFNEIVPWIYHHHERWDGKGYPDGLMGEDIPVAARIIAVAESYHSMMSGMPGHSPMGSDVAVQIITAEAGRAFDPFVVEAFKQVIQSETE